jgi:hypothetical protein
LHFAERVRAADKVEEGGGHGGRGGVGAGNDAERER